SEPTRAAPPKIEEPVPLPRPHRAAPHSTIPDDRVALQSGDRVLLIIEDDPAFARTMLELARERGFRGVVALEGQEGFDLARTLRPDAITLDLALPDVDGWVLLARLKHDPDTRHIPVHLVTGVSKDERR